jgi:hypothetical protein
LKLLALSVDLSH